MVFGVSSGAGDGAKNGEPQGGSGMDWRGAPKFFFFTN
jgi:hypothetical protein